MSCDYIVAPAAERDLLDVFRYFAEEVGDPDLADRMVAEIIAGFRAIAKTPGIGHQRCDLSDEPLLFWAVRKYLIIYRSEKRPLEIARVLHSARDVKVILEG